MSLSRFYLPATEWPATPLVLTDDEALHCSRVLRRQVGDTVEVFNGEGRLAVAKITALGKTRVSLTILEDQTLPPLKNRIHLLPALIKAEPFEWLLEKAVELGAVSVQPVITERTIISLSGDHLEKKLAKWRRHMIEAAKQCHTPFVTRLERPLPFHQALTALPADALKILPALSEHSRTLHGLCGGQREAYLTIGPEGDFTAEEEAMALEQGFQHVTLGPLILRAETAAITALAVLGHEMAKS